MRLPRWRTAVAPVRATAHQARGIRRVFGIQCKVSAIPYTARVSVHVLWARSRLTYSPDPRPHSPDVTATWTSGPARRSCLQCRNCYVCWFIRGRPRRARVAAESLRLEVFWCSSRCPGTTPSDASARHREGARGCRQARLPAARAARSGRGERREARRRGSRLAAGFAAAEPGKCQKLFITAPTTQALVVSSLRRNSLKT